MKPSDIFGVVVRTIGLFLIINALWSFLGGFLNLLFGGPSNVLGLIIVAIPSLFVGVWFLSGAKELIRWAYPEEYEKGE